MNSSTKTMLRYTLLLTMLLTGGCQFLPEIAHQPHVFNPFPQLSRVAVVPFFNMTDEPTLDGERVAWAYFTELQSVPGFEVVPVATVQEVIRRHGLQLAGVEEVRQLAQLLEVDAVVVGAITDYTPYYPPRLGLQVRWYSANPCFHPIPAGYGLPWGTPGEQHIPAPLVFEAEMASARAQLRAESTGEGPEHGHKPPDVQPPPADPPGPPSEGESGVQHLGFEQVAAGDSEPVVLEAKRPRRACPELLDPHCPVSSLRPLRAAPCAAASSDPVLQHTSVYVGNDPKLTEALENYFYFRDDRRFGGWEGYLQRSDDFIRFCCHMHISEMLSARGGAGETRVVWRWPTNR